MHELYELKEMLCEELKKYGEKGDMTTGSLDVVDKLAHTVKNLGKIIEMYEMEDDGYSGNYPMYYDYEGRGGSYENRNTRGMTQGNRGERSYARGRRGNVRRDAMGRYSRASEDVKEQLREIMEEAPDNMKSDILKLINKM